MAKAAEHEHESKSLGGYVVPALWHGPIPVSAVRRRKATVYDCHCERCDHKWLALKLPKACAGCKSRSWNVPEGSVPLGRPPSYTPKGGR